MLAVVLVRERNVIQAYSGERWDERRRRNVLVPLSAGQELGKVCTRQEKTGGREAVRAAWRMVLVAGSSSG